MRVCVVQPVIPKYSIAFFDALADHASIGDLKIFADTKTQTQLNQVTQTAQVSTQHLPHLVRGGLVFRPGRLGQVLAHKPDICVLGGNPRDIFSIFTTLILRLYGIRVFYWGMFHRIGGPSFFSQRIYRLFGRVAHGLLSYSNIGVQNLLSIGVRPDKIHIIGTAIDETAIAPFTTPLSGQDIADFKTAHGIEDKHILLQVVRLSAIKKPQMLVEVARALRAQGRQDFVFISIGGGDLVEEMQNLIATNALEDFIKLLPPLYDEAELAKWFHAATLFTIPSCVGLSAHHAFAYGLPIVTDSSPTQQASEFSILADGLNAELYIPGDSQDYARALQRIMDDPAHRVRLGENCKSTVYKKHSLSQKVANFIQALGL